MIIIIIILNKDTHSAVVTDIKMDMCLPFYIPSPVWIVKSISFPIFLS